MNQHVKEVVPFSLKDAPSLIEHLFPSMKISAEVQKERKAGQGQTLTKLGSYWKGRKPLFLARSCILGCLLPMSCEAETDIWVFEKLLGIDDASFASRVKREADFPAILEKAYDERMHASLRPEEVDHEPTSDEWVIINRHLNTSASSIEGLVEQLGIMRFGHKPRVSDTFAGAGSIPFEAARMGCDVYASDLNPIGCMLTWASLNIMSGDMESMRLDEQDQRSAITAAVNLIDELEVETNESGDRAKAFMYCVEAQCPQSQWIVPLLPTRIISQKLKSIVELIPDHSVKRYSFEVRSNVSDEELRSAERGTIVNGRLVHQFSTTHDGVAISAIRGDTKDSNGKSCNMLRPWNKEDIAPLDTDIFQERLYCIQWVTREGKGTYFAAPTSADIGREKKVERYVKSHITEWQRLGLVPDMAIAPGKNTSQPIWERGWTYWHHLFVPRQLLALSQIISQIQRPISALMVCQILNFSSRLCRINSTASQGGAVKYQDVFANQSLNTLYNYGVRGTSFLPRSIIEQNEAVSMAGKLRVENHEARLVLSENDIYITDPPYADAVNYHEITEFRGGAGF